MIFKLNKTVRMICAKSTGKDIKTLQATPLASLGNTLAPFSTTNRRPQVTPRGSAYLSAGRMSDDKETQRILRNF